jgi:hypothetical protein
MIPRTAALLLFVFMLIGHAVAVDPIALGCGTRDDVFNLDAGSGQPGHNYFMGSSGFVPPAVPQPMVVDPGVLVYQAEKYRDQVQAMKQETSDKYNDTQTLLQKIWEKEQSMEEKERYVDAKAKEAQDHAYASTLSAAKAQEYLNSTNATYGKILNLSKVLEGNLNLIRALVNESKISVDKSALNAQMTEAHLNKTLASEG